MAKYTQSELELASHQSLTHPGIFVGTAVNVATALSGQVFIYHANVETTAHAEPVRYNVQVSYSASGNEDWVTAIPFRTSVTASDTEALTATEPIGETSLAVTLTAGFTGGTYVYIQDAGTLADSEWAYLEDIVTDTSLELADGLTTGKDSSDVAWDEARAFTGWLDLAGVQRVRLYVWHNAATGSNIHFRGVINVATDLG